MSKTQRSRLTRKPSGGAYHTASAKGKREYDRAGAPTLTGLGTHQVVLEKKKFGHYQTKVLRADHVNLLDPKTKKYSKAKLKIVVENKANENFIRRNILTKGAIIDTDKGKARITSRPGQTGALTAVLV